MEGNAPAGDGRAVLADAVWCVHTAVVVFFVVAAALPWRWAWWAALVGAFTMQAQWQLNGNVCVLTDLERILRRSTAPTAPREGNFLAGLAERIVGRPVPRRWTDRLAYAVLWGGAGIAGIRLATE